MRVSGYASIVSIAFVYCVLLVGTPARADISQGLVAYYPFDGNALDESGNANHGVPIGAVLTEDRFGRAENAYYFDGVNDTVWIGNNPLLNVQQAVTISAWIYLDSYPAGWVSVVNKWHSYVLQLNRQRGLILTIYDSSYKGVWRNVAVEQDFALGQWYHVAASFDEVSGAAALYINGVAVNFEPRSDNGYPAAINDSTDDLKLGSENNNQWWHGRIDDVRIYDRVLQPLEIVELYNETPTEPFNQRLMELLIEGLEIDTASGQVRLIANIDPADPVFSELLNNSLDNSLNNPQVKLSLELQTATDRNGNAQFGVMAQGQVPTEILATEQKLIYGQFPAETEDPADDDAKQCQLPPHTPLEEFIREKIKELKQRHSHKKHQHHSHDDEHHRSKRHHDRHE